MPTLCSKMFQNKYKTDKHILSGCFFTLFNANTVSVHVGKEISTVDIQGHLDEETIRKAEKMANEVIQENIKVEFLTQPLFLPSPAYCY